MAGRHRPAAGRVPVNRFLLAAHINAHDTAYSPDWWGLPMRAGLAVFVIVFGVFVASGLTVAPADAADVQTASVITSDGPALCGGQR